MCLAWTLLSDDGEEGEKERGEGNAWERSQTEAVRGAVMCAQSAFQGRRKRAREKEKEKSKAADKRTPSTLFLALLCTATRCRLSLSLPRRHRIREWPVAVAASAEPVWVDSLLTDDRLSLNRGGRPQTLCSCWCCCLQQTSALLLLLADVLAPTECCVCPTREWQAARGGSRALHHCTASVLVNTEEYCKGKVVAVVQWHCWRSSQQCWPHTHSAGEI